MWQGTEGLTELLAPCHQGRVVRSLVLKQGAGGTPARRCVWPRCEVTQIKKNIEKNTYPSFSSLHEAEIIIFFFPEN